MLAFAACILLAAIVIPLSDPIVSLIFERQVICLLEQSYYFVK